MAFSDFELLICWKRSGWEWDLHRYPHLDANSLAEFYRQQNRDPERMKASHDRQAANFAKVVSAISTPSSFVSRNDLSRERIATANVFIVGGGDNHFTWASHYCPFEIPMLAINSDKQPGPNNGSDGGMLYFSTDEFLQLLPALQRGEFDVEEWTLAEVLLNGKSVGFATSEVFLGERERTMCSRNWIQYNGVSEQHVGSGELLATPAGVSGWYHSATVNEKRIADFSAFLASLQQTTDSSEASEPPRISVEELCRRWEQSAATAYPAKDTRALYSANMERFTGGGRSYEMVSETIESGEEIEITSLNDSDGIIRIDADEALTYAFPPGAKAVVRVAKVYRPMIVNPFAA